MDMDPMASRRQRVVVVRGGGARWSRCFSLSRYRGCGPASVEKHGKTGNNVGDILCTTLCVTL
jgi:hypothetical protein